MLDLKPNWYTVYTLQQRLGVQLNFLKDFSTNRVFAFLDFTNKFIGFYSRKDCWYFENNLMRYINLAEIGLIIEYFEGKDKL